MVQGRGGPHEREAEMEHVRPRLQIYLVACLLIVGLIPTVLFGVSHALRPGGETNDNLYQMIAWLGFSVLLAATACSFLLRRLYAPLRDLSETVRSASGMESGQEEDNELEHAEDNAGAMPRELADLASEFGLMIRRMEETHAALKGKVAQRSEELDEANMQLWVANAELKKQKAEAEAIFGCMADPVVIAGKDGGVLRTNHAAQHILGIERMNEDGSFQSSIRVYQFSKPDGTPFPFNELPFSRAIQQGKTARNVHMVLSPSRNNVRHFDVSVAPLLNEHGEPESAISVFRDISRMVEAEEEIRGQNRKLSVAFKQVKEAYEAKDLFLANMSHELRTPLNAILGFSQLLQLPQFGQLSEKQDHYVDNIVKSGQHLLALVNDVLDLAKIGAGKLTLEQKRVRVQEAVSSVMEIISPLALEKNIELSEKLDGELPRVSADPKRLQQILFNLLSNAVKFTGAEGQVCIEAARDQSLNQVSIAVKDTGIGIPAERQQSIFEEFEQGDGSYARDQQGTGLGLSLTRKLVEMHQGTIDVQSELGRGSVFTVRLPASVETVPAAEGKPTVREFAPIQL